MVSDDSRRILVTRTYLHMQSPAQLEAGAPPRMQPQWIALKNCSVPEWRALYASIGHPWHWHDRDAWSDERLWAHLAGDNVRIFRMDCVTPSGFVEGAGFVELEKHSDGSVEIAYLGLDRRVLGMGLGRWLVAQAAREAWALKPNRVWLHTCTLDAPAALPNYIARGFVVEKTEQYETTLH